MTTFTSNLPTAGLMDCRFAAPTDTQSAHANSTLPALSASHATVACDLTSAERALVETVWREGRALYRDLPWRRVDDPYAILLSEIMLQQTQVSRVDRYWQRFLATFPTLDALASAETPLVLEMWQGLGYNRRALALKRTAEECVRHYSGQLPRTYEELLALPGIGPATAGGVMAFAYRAPAVYLETNVRTVFLHELYPDIEGVNDKQLVPHIERTCSTDDPRGWYYALLDYGTHLKATIGNASRRSKHHMQQSKFEGSRRQKRAELVRYILAEREATLEQLHAALTEFEESQGREAPDIALTQSIAEDLTKEGFFTKETTNNRTLYCA